MITYSTELETKISSMFKILQSKLGAMVEWICQTTCRLEYSFGRGRPGFETQRFVFSFRLVFHHAGTTRLASHPCARTIYQSRVVKSVRSMLCGRDPNGDLALSSSRDPRRR